MVQAECPGLPVTQIVTTVQRWRLGTQKCKIPFSPGPSPLQLGFLFLSVFIVFPQIYSNLFSSDTAPSFFKRKSNWSQELSSTRKTKHLFASRFVVFFLSVPTGESGFLQHSIPVFTWVLHLLLALRESLTLLISSLPFGIQSFPPHWHPASFTKELQWLGTHLLKSWVNVSLKTLRCLTSFWEDVQDHC